MENVELMKYVWYNKKLDREENLIESKAIYNENIIVDTIMIVNCTGLDLK